MSYLQICFGLGICLACTMISGYLDLTSKIVVIFIRFTAPFYEGQHEIEALGINSFFRNVALWEMLSFSGIW